MADAVVQQPSSICGSVGRLLIPVSDGRRPDPATRSEPPKRAASLSTRGTLSRVRRGYLSRGELMCVNATSKPILRPSAGLAFRPRRRFYHRSTTGRAGRFPQPRLRSPQLHGRSIHRYSFQWYGYHSYGMHSQWIGMQCIATHCIPMDSKRPWNTVGDRLWERGQGFFTTMPAKQSARLLPPPHHQGRGGRRRDHRGQGRRWHWHWHHCRQPHWVTEGTMLWGSRQGTARREVSFPKESV